MKNKNAIATTNRLQKVPDLTFKKRVDLLLWMNIIDTAQEAEEYLAEIMTNNPGNVWAAKLDRLTGEARDEYLKKTDRLLNLPGNENIRHTIWESNHRKITAAISNIMNREGVMPSKSTLARETGLSRKCINAHLVEYLDHPLFREQAEQFRFMAPRVLAIVFQRAIDGDMKAAKLYLQAMGGNLGSLTNPGATIHNQQNNFIQINGMTLSQESIKQLSPAQLQQIETILKTVIPQQPQHEST